MPPTKKAPPKKILSSDQIQAQISVLEERMDALERRYAKHTPGRKPKFELQRPNEAGVCAYQPDCDSKKCEIASTYRFQQECRGTACVIVNRKYVQDQRERNNK